MMDKWIDWPLELHQEEEQIQRVDSSTSVKLNNLDKAAMTAIAENGYKVSLTKCTCMDFNTRQKPCKHIYKLAQDLGLMRVKGTASKNDTPIADFTSGFAKGWFFAVGKWYAKSLDLTYTTKDVDGETVIIPRQGYDFSFNPGSVVYDSPEAYTLIWKEAFDLINVVLQVHSAYKNKRTYSLDFNENNVLVAQIDIKYSALTFDVYIPNRETRRLEEKGRFSCSNSNYVELLTTGSTTLSNGDYFCVEDFY